MADLLVGQTAESCYCYVEAIAPKMMWQFSHLAILLLTASCPLQHQIPHRDADRAVELKPEVCDAVSVGVGHQVGVAADDLGAQLACDIAERG